MSIQIKNLCKNYGKKEVLKNISLTFEENKIYGLLGRNGVGKSTLLKVISNRLLKTSGEISIDGISKTDSNEAQQKIYMVGEDSFVPLGMKVKNALKLTGQFYDNFDMDYACRLAEQFGLPLKSRISSLSTGYRTIYKIVTALSVNTPYIILDEPTLGLDSYHRDLFYKLVIEKYSESPCTIILSTHLIGEVSTVIENAVILHNGEVLKDEAMDLLLSCGYTVSGKMSDVDAFCKDKKVIGNIETIGGLKSVCIEGTPNKSEIPDNLEISRLDLQQLFIKLTN